MTEKSLSYLISELLDNIYEHSQSPNGFVFSQYLEKEGMISLCIADTGITIAGSFEKAGLYQKEIDGKETEALKLANEGYSTKNRPKLRIVDMESQPLKLCLSLV